MSDPRTTTAEAPPEPQKTRSAGGTPAPDSEAVRARTRAQFDRWAVWYDRSLLNEFVFFPSIRRCQEEIARWNARRNGRTYRMLDVGCGTGTLLTVMARDPRCERLVGLDYAEQMIRRATQKFAAGPHADRLRAVRGDAERLPFASAAFDVVTCCNSFHHYPDQSAAAREFRRVLRPGGVLILIDGFRDNVIGWVLFDVFVAWVESDIHHASWSEVRHLLLSAGFSHVEQSKMNVLAPMLVSVAHV